MCRIVGLTAYIPTRVKRYSAVSLETIANAYRNNTLGGRGFSENRPSGSVVPRGNQSCRGSSSESLSMPGKTQGKAVSC